MRLYKWGLFAISLCTIFPFGVANANRHENICLANPDPQLCGLLSNPFSAILDIFDVIVPGFGLLIFWGPIVFGLWFTTKSPAIASIFGLIIISVVTPLHPQAVGMALILVAVSTGIGLIQVFQRIKQTV